MKKLISLDLDGTLLNSNKKISLRNYNAIIMAKEAGHKIVFATARPYRAVVEVLPKELWDETIVCINGAQIYEGQTRIYERIIDKSEIRKFISAISKKHVGNYIAIETDEKLYSNSDSSEFFGNVENNIVDVVNFDCGDTSKLVIGTKNIEDTEAIKNILPKGTRIIFTDNGLMGQIVPENATKLNGVLQVAKNSNIELKDVIAFGDDNNDFEIIQECGVGVAMGNAIPEIKKIADYITETNENDGVAVFLEKFLDL